MEITLLPCSAATYIEKEKLISTMSTGANKSAKSLSSSKRGFASTYFEMNVFNAFKSDLGKLKI